MATVICERRWPPKTKQDKVRFERCEQFAEQIAFALYREEWDRVSSIIDQFRFTVDSDDHAETLAQTDLPIRIVNALEKEFKVIWIEDLKGLSRSAIMRRCQGLNLVSLGAIDRIAAQYEITLDD